MTLNDLSRGASARIARVLVHGGDDAIGQRLGELGFVPGEIVRLLRHGPLGRDPLAVQIGFTRFALRRGEAQRIEITPLAEGAPA